MHTRPLRPRSILRLDSLEDRQVPAPVVLDPNLAVRPVVSGLTTPTGLAVLDSNEFLVLEKNTGKVQHVVDGQVEGTLLDLAVNNASERGLLGIALDPGFQRNRAVYLYWTQPADPAPGDGTNPSVREGPDEPALGADTDNVLAVPLLGNRVDRFIWDGDSLEFDRNLIRLRAFQNDGVPTPPDQGDAGQPALGNHDGGVIRFGRDGKLYVITGDVGRRGLAQNNDEGPTPDDQFGGPLPDDAHLSGVILRLNTDGSAPRDNPFYLLGRLTSFVNPEVGDNLQKVFAYGIRNSFGLTIDPFTGNVWDTENADDSFDEVNLVRPGFNSGWIQTMGPLSRVAEFKEIETTMFAQNLQQLRYPPSRIADTPEEARDRMVDVPGSRYSDPEFSWKFAVPPTALAFMDNKTLGGDYARDLVLGNGAGQLMEFDMAGNRREFRFDSAGLRDLVDDNSAKFVPNESASLVFAEGFGIITDLQRDPSGGLFVVSLTDGAVYEVSKRAAATRFEARATGAEEVPPVTTQGRAFLEMRVSGNGEKIKFEVSGEGLSNVTAVHLHLGARGEEGPPVVTLFEADPGGGQVRGRIAKGDIRANDLEGPLAGMTLADLIAEIEAGRIYLNVHTDDGVAPPNTGPGDFPDGEARGQVTVVE
jgi:aldose sugar dehydrogenase